MQEKQNHIKIAASPHFSNFGCSTLRQLPQSRCENKERGRKPWGCCFEPWEGSHHERWVGRVARGWDAVGALDAETVHSLVCIPCRHTTKCTIDKHCSPNNFRGPSNSHPFTIHSTDTNDHGTQWQSHLCKKRRSGHKDCVQMNQSYTPSLSLPPSTFLRG